MEKRSMKLQVLAILLLLLSVQILTGETFYISTDGNDSNPGTLSSPWAHLQHAIQVAGPGDTVIMRGGVYETNEVWIRGELGMGGANGQYLTIKNYPGEIVSVGGDRRVIVDGPPFLRIEGLHFRLPYRISGGGEGFQVVNNTFEGPQPSFGAIEFFADDGLVEGNIISITGGGDTQDHGIYLHAGHNNILRNNFISGHSGYGIHVYDAVSSGGLRAADGYDNILLEGNVILNSQFRAGIIISPGDGVEAKNITIEKNTIINNVINGIRINSNSHDIEIYNNTIYGNGWGASHPDDQSAISLRANQIHDVILKNNIIEVSDAGGFHIQNRQGSAGVVAERNLYWGQAEPRLAEVTDSNPLFQDPMFEDAGKNDFRLRESSPAIDTGVNVGISFNGAAPDLGAIEFGDSATSVSGTSDVPAQFSLHQNYPNPFNPTTRIAYDVGVTARVTLDIYDLAGRHLKTLIDQEKAPGSYIEVWDGNDNDGLRVSSGVYFCRMMISGATVNGVQSEIRKMTLLR